MALGRPHPEDSWADIAGKTVKRGAKVSEEELYTVGEYLATNTNALPPIKVNIATEISKERQRAPLMSIKDLKRVSGIEEKSYCSTTFKGCGGVGGLGGRGASTGVVLLVDTPDAFVFFTVTLPRLVWSVTSGPAPVAPVTCALRFSLLLFSALPHSLLASPLSVVALTSNLAF